MATEVLDASVFRIEGEAQSINVAGTLTNWMTLPAGIRGAHLLCSAAWRLALLPKVLHVVYFNGTTYVEYVKQATDRDAGTHVPLDSMAATHYLYVGTSDPVRGLWIDIGTNANAIAATLDVEYCSTALSESAPLAWTDVGGDSDGTTSGGATLAVDGIYTWTLVEPKRSHLGTWANRLFSKCYWVRFCPSTTLSAAVDINGLLPVYKDTNLGYMATNVEYALNFDLARVSGFQAEAAGAQTLNVTWIT